ncbi:HAD family hydrolase [Aliiruegeria lutimaris]|uniref:Putative hydrolase of the HAD superfamily n=1 Tax=Aliiruegeria lutimaris TaxID=571298 RepID=A0A1G9FS10_9RHOB|nr:HAD family hydrolase [Aliiruegeria lutimaris]SDK91122.1 putative hydrolase of the HAD superfamily [Aliiruegeria lutimaris]
MLVFDLDDTLYLEREFVLSGYRYLDGWVAARTGTAGFGDACIDLFGAGERRRVFDRACERLEMEPRPELIAELVAAYRGHPPEIALAEDAGRYLAARAGPFGLITDGPEHMQRAKIAALKLERWIAHIRPTGAWPAGFSKPHPRAFEEMDKLCSPGPMVYVADNPAKDFVTPRARGWITVQIRRPGAIHSPVPPDDRHAAHAECQSFDELDEVIAGFPG